MERASRPFISWTGVPPVRYLHKRAGRPFHYFSITALTVDAELRRWASTQSMPLPCKARVSTRCNTSAWEAAVATGMDVSSARISSRFFRLPQASSPMTNGCVTLPKTVEFHVFLRGRDGGPAVRAGFTELTRSRLEIYHEVDGVNPDPVVFIERPIRRSTESI